VVQNWSEFDFQPQLSSGTIQLFNDTMQQSFFEPNLVDDRVQPSPQHPSSAVPTPYTPPNRVIGTISHRIEPDDYIFSCISPICKQKTFARWYDLRRHYYGTHCDDGSIFWCQVQGCDRSNVEGGRSFPRKDKLSDHVRKVHRRG
jgi:hypothetical protein